MTRLFYLDKKRQRYCCCGELFGGLGLEFPKPPGDELGLFCIPPGELPNVPELNPLPKPLPFVPLLLVPFPAGCPFKFGCAKVCN
jgi:hypothetical protein